MTDQPSFDSDFRDRLDQLFQWRRDVRRFDTRPLDEATVPALLTTACTAPSVGLSQPWRFVRVRDVARRASVRSIFERCNAQALALQPSERAGLYARLKLSGLDDAPEHIAVFVDPATELGGRLGRATMPETIGYSAVLAIHTLWLAAHARGYGLGWVSILDADAVTALLDVPVTWSFVALLCLGTPLAPSDIPELERRDWQAREPLADRLFER